MILILKHPFTFILIRWFNKNEKTINDINIFGCGGGREGGKVVMGEGNEGVRQCHLTEFELFMDQFIMLFSPVSLLVTKTHNIAEK